MPERGILDGKQIHNFPAQEVELVISVCIQVPQLSLEKLSWEPYRSFEWGAEGALWFLSFFSIRG